MSDRVDEFLGFCSVTWGAHHEHLCFEDRGHLEQPNDPQLHECDCGESIYDEDLKEREA